MNIDIISKWNDKLDKFTEEKKDIYFSEEYVNLACGKTQVPLCIVCEESEKIMLMPFLRGEYKDYYDFETPYGYGGPISNCDDKEWSEKALTKIIEYFSSKKYLAGFVRFHPMLNNADLCRNVFAVIDDRKTVVIDTSVPNEKIWESFSSKNRNRIRKAENNKLQFIRDDSFLYIEDFKRIYKQTMDRVGATNFYYFDDEYYKKLITILKGKSFLGIIRKDNEVICSGVFMYDNLKGHYHLGASNWDYSTLGLNDFMFWNVSCEFYKMGIKEFHLGGGTDSNEENSLFKFKHTFSSNLKQFSIGKMIFNKQAYDSVCKEWTERNPDKVEKYKHHLLKYRY